jgi:hypothetical protein
VVSLGRIIKEDSPLNTQSTRIGIGTIGFLSIVFIREDECGLIYRELSKGNTSI